MSDLTFNKIAGAVLATGLAIIGLGELSSIVFKHEAPAKPGYKLDVVEDSGGGAAPVADVAPDWGTVLTPANVTAGQAISQKCVSCHSFAAGGPVIQGPSLYGVVGRPPGSYPGMAYSDGMKAFAGTTKVWDYDHLYEFLKNPQKYISGTKMSFVGLKAPEDRAAMIAYLHSLGSTLPIPAPKPAAAAAAPAAAAGAAPAAGAAAAPAKGAAATGATPAAAGATAAPAAGAVPAKK